MTTNWLTKSKASTPVLYQPIQAKTADEVGAKNYIPTVKASGPTRNAKDALKAFEQAVIELAFIGAQDPLDHEEIREEYARTRKLVLRHLTK
jgi:hypothetical protein